MTEDKKNVGPIKSLEDLKGPEKSNSGIDAEGFVLSTQALSSLMFCLQKGITEQTDVTKLIASLKFAPKPNMKLYVLNPPVVTVSPEMEANIKKKFLERAEQLKKGVN